MSQETKPGRWIGVGLVVLLVGAAFVAATGGAHVWSGKQRQECSAILLDQCTTGVHTQGENRLLVGFEWSNFDGVLEQRFKWEQGTFVVRCQLTSSGGASCTFHGDFPRTGSTFLHRCVEVSGGPSDWTCIMGHTGEFPLYGASQAANEEHTAWLEVGPQDPLSPAPAS